MKRTIFLVGLLMLIIMVLPPGISEVLGQISSNQVLQLPPANPPHLEVDKSVCPNLTCGVAAVTLNVTGAGEPTEEQLPLDIVLIIDRSGSMSRDGKLSAAQTAAKAFIDLLDPLQDRVGLVSYSTSATLNQGLTTNFNAVKSAVDGLSATGFTNIADAIDIANQEFTTHGRSPGVVWVEILLTDGLPNRWGHSPVQGTAGDFDETAAQYARDAAQAASSADIMLYTIGLGSPPDISQYFLDDLPASGHTYQSDDPAGSPYNHDGLAYIGGGHYYHAPTPSDLQFMFEQISEELSNIAGTDVVVTEVLPSGVHYVDGSAVPSPDYWVSPDGHTLEWNLGTIIIGETKTITFDVTFDDPGYQLVDVYPDTQVDYTDYLGDPASEAFPPTYIRVLQPAADAGGDVIINSGQSTDLDGSGSEILGGCGEAGGDIQYQWSIKDGAVIQFWSTDPTVAVSPAMNTTYTLEVRCSALPYCIDSDEVMVTVGECIPPAADFGAEPTNGCAPLTVDFTDSSTGATSWYWDFGDGDTSAAQNTSHTYTSPGTYTVSLTVTNRCGEATDTTSITARNCAPSPIPCYCTCCDRSKYLTVDWEGNNTTKPLYTNGKLAVDLLGSSSDLINSLFLERATHAPVVGTKTYYLIVIRKLDEIPPLPENTEAIVVFNVTPADAVFDKDIFLTLGLTESQLPANALNVTMNYYDDVNNVWMPLNYQAGGPNGVAELTLSAPINHFSIFGVLAEVGPPSPAHFVPSGLSIEPIVEKVWEHVTFVTKTGESVTITANIVNDGGQGGTYVVELKLNGEAVDTKTVTLGAGQSQQVSFTLSGLDDGQYEVEVAGLNGEFTASRTITWWLIIGLIIWVIVILAVLVWGIRRRRRATEEG